MKREFSQDIGGNTIVFSIKWNQNAPDEAPVISCAGLSGQPAGVTIPAQIAIPKWLGLSCETGIVTEIEKKAFLSKKVLKKVFLPDSIRKVGEWAFAYCDHLEEVTMPQSALLGKAVFLNCGSLKKIRVQKADDFREKADSDADLASLLATIASNQEAGYLLDLREAGSPEWYAKWDARMVSIWQSSDMEGYARQVLCGEEDYGSTDQKAFASASRRMKVSLLMQRLLHPLHLSEPLREQMEEYLRNQEETWQVILEQHGEDRSWYELFVRLGCLEGNSERILLDLGNRHPEMKAYFIEKLSDMTGGSGSGEDFLEGLAL